MPRRVVRMAFGAAQGMQALRVANEAAKILRFVVQTLGRFSLALGSELSWKGPAGSVPLPGCEQRVALYGDVFVEAWNHFDRQSEVVIFAVDQRGARAKVESPSALGVHVRVRGQRV